jgi:hypothetical protein
MKSKLNIDEDGSKYWMLPNGILHREDGPAVETSNGVKFWYINGLMHREDGPGIETSDVCCTLYWAANGIEYTEQEHMIKFNWKSKLTIDHHGTKEWKLPSGKHHREDGPAIEYASGNKEWYINGIEEYTEQDYKYKIRSIKLTKILK